MLATRSDADAPRRRLVVSAIALIGAASGFGVIVNSLLATVSPTLVDDDPRTLLLGGISALVVGGPAWWLAWRPGRTGEADAADPARRVYLVAVFGASAIVGLVTLLIIGFFACSSSLLGVDEGGGLIERIRGAARPAQCDGRRVRLSLRGMAALSRDRPEGGRNARSGVSSS